MSHPYRKQGWAVWYSTASHPCDQHAATATVGTPADAMAEYDRARFAGHRGTYGDRDQRREIPDGALCALVRIRPGIDVVVETWTHRAPSAAERAEREAAQAAKERAEREQLCLELAGLAEPY